MKTKVLLLGGGLQGLSFGESLRKEAGYEVSVISDDYENRKSVFFQTRFLLPANDYDDNLRSVLAKSHFDVIVPMGDKAASFLSRNKNRIETEYGIKCAIADYSSLSLVEDKSRLMAFCMANSFPHPKTERIDNDCLETAAKTVGFPSLIKPDFSVGARGITLVNSVEELKRVFPGIFDNYGTCTLQEYIDNPDYYYNVMIYRNSNGKCLGHAITRIYRMHPVKGGSSSCCVTIENELLFSICLSVLDKLGWVGMADFDVLQRKDTMEYKIIEINPRVPASLRAAQISGVNFPQIIVNDALGQSVPSYKYLPGKTLRYLGLDLLWFLHSPQRFRRLGEWLQFFGKNIYYQDIYMNDWSTWYSWLVAGLRKLKRT